MSAPSCSTSPNEQIQGLFSALSRSLPGEVQH